MPTPHLLRTRWRLLLLLLLVGALALAGASQGAEPARGVVVVGPVVGVSPTSGAAGDPVQLSGAGFTPDATLAAHFFSPSTGLQPLGMFPAGADGMFTFDTSVPANAQPGETAAFGVENADDPGEAASVPFEVTGEIGDEEPKKPEFCKVTITLVSVRLTSNELSDGTVFPVTVQTLPASEAPGASVDVEPVVGGEETAVGEVAREYFVPKPAFPHRVLISAQIPYLLSGFFGLITVKRTFVSDPAKRIVVCPDSQDVEVIVEATTPALLGARRGETYTLKYHVEVTEVDAQ